MKVPEKILSGLKKEKSIFIAAHINPDGDALGAALALAEALESKGKETFVYSRDPVPVIYSFLPGYERISSDPRSMLKHRPVMVLLDCNSPERAAVEKYGFKSSIVIDHHETEKDFGDIKWIDPGAAATGLMVFYLVKALGVGITKEMATNLYTAISTDTGTFRYSNTSAEVLKVSAELVDAGAPPNLIAEQIYETWDRKRFRLLVIALNTLDIRKGIAITHITKEMFRRTGTKPADTENFSNLPRMIESVKISAVFRETGRDIWKVSLRSKGASNVARIAEFFDGGGHKNAAGFSIKGDLKSAKSALLKVAGNLNMNKR
ncbi:MAG: bifunctional oligoribonuclease/PAP phosphatase NrnA [Nitrospirota bacterium]|nr:bifunctional oligoribonuclease/PAP phosphatase NrnA [Nitrospirota bacterium]